MFRMQAEALQGAEWFVVSSIVFGCCSQMLQEQQRQQQLKQASPPSSAHQEMAATLWESSSSNLWQIEYPDRPVGFMNDIKLLAMFRQLFATFTYTEQPD